MINVLFTERMKNMKKVKVMAAVLIISLLCACTSSTSTSVTDDSSLDNELAALQAQIEALASENEALLEGLAGQNETVQEEATQSPEPAEVEQNAQAAATMNEVPPSTEATKEAEQNNTADEGYSRKNPAPVGTAQTVTVNDWDETYTVTMTVNWVNRGEDAWYYIQEANRFNDPPSDGMEYIIANITATLEDSKDDLAVDFSHYDFTAFSENSSEYEDVYVVVPTPEFEGEAYSGASITGNVVFMVDSNDAAPKIAYGRESSGAGGIWMALFYE